MFNDRLPLDYSDFLNTVFNGLCAIGLGKIQVFLTSGKLLDVMNSWSFWLIHPRHLPVTKFCMCNSDTFTGNSLVITI